MNQKNFHNAFLANGLWIPEKSRHFSGQLPLNLRAGTIEAMNSNTPPLEQQNQIINYNFFTAELPYELCTNKIRIC